MREAKCSLLLQEEADYVARIKALPIQTVTVYQDKGLESHHRATNPAASSLTDDDEHGDNHDDDNDTPTTSFPVEFKGATILQLEPIITSSTNNSMPQHTMPVTLTVGGRCVLTVENYQDFTCMMRTKEQAAEMNLHPNGNFDWPSVDALLTCPVCAQQQDVPQPRDFKDHEYWMVFYPLLQITTVKQGSSHMTLGTRTICRLMCLECMEDLLEGLTLQIRPTSKKRLCFTLPAADVLAEAGSASFLEDGPPRPETHPHVDDILDAWTLYNLWEHSGAWEALQNDYRLVLSRSMHVDATAAAEACMPTNANVEPRLKERMGMPCGNEACNKVHGQPFEENGNGGTATICRLVYKCRECNCVFYCSKACRAAAKADHAAECLQKQQERAERREKRAKKVQCDTCQKNFPYTKMKKCSRCRKATYCSVDCQRLDWQRHRDVCC